jgi:hypothetical protein
MDASPKWNCTSKALESHSSRGDPVAFASQFWCYPSFFARAPFFRPTADKRNVPWPSIKSDFTPSFYEQGTNSNENIETGRSSVRVKEHN